MSAASFVDVVTLATDDASASVVDALTTLLSPDELVRAGRYVREGLRLSTTEIDALEFAVREEPEGAVVGRPERVDRILGARQRLR